MSLSLEELNAIRAKYKLAPLSDDPDDSCENPHASRVRRMTKPRGWTCRMASKCGYTPCEWHPLDQRPARLSDRYHGRADRVVWANGERLNVCEGCARELETAVTEKREAVGG